MLRDYRYVEATGLGVPRKIVRGMQEHNGTEPDLIEEEDRFTVRLWKRDTAGVAVAMAGKPNVVYFLVDDMGYGDVSCLNPGGRIATPRFDRLAREGMVCRDAPLQFRGVLAVPLRGAYRPLQLALEVAEGHRQPLRAAADRRDAAYRGQAAAAPRLPLRRDRQVAPGHGLAVRCRGRGPDRPRHRPPGRVRQPRDFLPPHAAGQPASGEQGATERQRALWREFFARRIAGGPHRARLRLLLRRRTCPTGRRTATSRTTPPSARRASSCRRGCSATTWPACRVPRCRTGTSSSSCRCSPAPPTATSPPAPPPGSRFSSTCR